MRKIYAYLFLTAAFLSCDNKEELPSKSQSIKNPTQTYIINGDIEYTSEITDGSKPKAPIFIYDIPKKPKEVTPKKITSKTTEQSVNIYFDYPPTGPSNSGCTIKRYNNGNSYYTDSGVYGTNPFPYPTSEGKSSLVRGFKLPHQNLYYQSLVLIASNREEKVEQPRGIWNKNVQRGTALSIEYPFQPNTTYEILLQVCFYDNVHIADKTYSTGYPTIYAQLKNSGVIDVINYRDPILRDPCSNEGINDLNYSDYSFENYTRSYTLDSRAIIWRYLTFKFSPTQAKNALLISLHPAIGQEGYGAAIPKNSYTMVLPLVKITPKEFDPSINDPDRVNPRGR